MRSSRRKARLPDGEQSLTVVNEGVAPHEVVVTPAGQPDRELARIPQLSTGEQETLTLDLPSGTYDLGCYLPGHFGAGMRGIFVVP